MRHAPTPASLRRQPPSSARGFTLIELMITVAVIAILTGIALPSYRDYIVRTQLTNATNGLSSVRANMERFFQDNRTYATTGSFTTPCADTSTTGVANRTFGSFVVTCSGTPDGSTFTLVATGSGPVNGFVYTINQMDARATTAAPTGWTTCATSWITQKGQACT